MKLTQSPESAIAQHTPGPWAVSKNTPLIFGRTQGAGLEPLGFIYGPPFEERSEVGRRAKADVALCAAAPELLDVAQKLVSAFMSHTQWNGDPPAEIMQARAVIAKATQEEAK